MKQIWNVYIKRSVSVRRVVNFNGLIPVNTHATAVAPAPDTPMPKASRWPSGFFKPVMTSQEICDEHVQSINDFLADDRTDLVRKYGWR